jgi:hypothetical protein
MSGFLPERSLAAAITSPADPRKTGQTLSSQFSAKEARSVQAARVFLCLLEYAACCVHNYGQQIRAKLGKR